MKLVESRARTSAALLLSEDDAIAMRSSKEPVHTYEVGASSELLLRIYQQKIRNLKLAE